MFYKCKVSKLKKALMKLKEKYQMQLALIRELETENSIVELDTRYFEQDAMWLKKAIEEIDRIINTQHVHDSYRAIYEDYKWYIIRWYWYNNLLVANAKEEKLSNSGIPYDILSDINKLMEDL